MARPRFSRRSWDSPLDPGQYERSERKCSTVKKWFGRSEPQLDYQVVDATAKLPFSTRTFDRVVASFIYGFDVKEALRVLNPGGKIILFRGNDKGANSRYVGLDKAVKKGEVEVSEKYGCTIIEKGNFRKTPGRGSSPDRG